MLHLAKLAVGVSDIAHLRRVQEARLTAEQKLCHRTRHSPRRRAEIANNGSIYWVVAGILLVRQRIVDIIEASYEDGTRCAGLILDPTLVQVEGRPVKAFQGWRYLEQADAPLDLTDDHLQPGAFPPALRNELRALCLI